jgi:hypothetical protein
LDCFWIENGKQYILIVLDLHHLGLCKNYYKDLFHINIIEYKFSLSIVVYVVTMHYILFGAWGEAWGEPEPFAWVPEDFKLVLTDLFIYLIAINQKRIGKFYKNC